MRNCEAARKHVKDFSGGESPEPRASMKSTPPPATDPLLAIPLAAECPDGWRKFIDEYTDHLKVSGFSPLTIKCYPRLVQRFIAWMEKNGCNAPMKITPELCMAFQRAIFYSHHRRGKPFNVQTHIRFISCIRSFTKFLKRAGHILIDPGLAMQYPRAPRRLPRNILSEDDVAKILSIPDVRTAKGYRDRTIIEVLYATGIRTGEVANLDVDDIDLATGRLRIRFGKGKKDRWVPLGEIATEYLAGYIKNIRCKLTPQIATGPLFIGWRGGKRITGSMINKDVAHYYKKAGIEWHVVPYTFRHTCATHMLKHGANLRHVQEILGHESIATTEIYTHVEIGDLAEAHAKFHPRERL